MKSLIPMTNVYFGSCVIALVILLWTTPDSMRSLSSHLGDVW